MSDEKYLSDLIDAATLRMGKILNVHMFYGDPEKRTRELKRRAKRRPWQEPYIADLDPNIESLRRMKEAIDEVKREGEK